MGLSLRKRDSIASLTGEVATTGRLCSLVDKTNSQIKPIKEY